MAALASKFQPLAPLASGIGRDPGLFADAEHRLAVGAGFDGMTFAVSGEEGVDVFAVDTFLARYRERHSIETGADGKTMLSVGKEAWILPIPLVKDAKGWHFARARARRKSASAASAATNAAPIPPRGLHDAQMDYAEEDRDGDGVMEYARKFFSTDGKHDGLYWAEDDRAKSARSARCSAMPRPAATGTAITSASSKRKDRPGPAARLLLQARR